MTDLYQWDGSDANPNQPRPGQGQPGQPGGRDLYQWDGSDVRPQVPQPVTPPGYNPWQADAYAPQQQQPGMRARQFWGGRGQGGGDIYVTAMPGSEVIINNASGEVNMQGGRNYDYRYPGGQNYNYQQYIPRQCCQPSYQQYRGCYNPGQQYQQQISYAPDYYSQYQMQGMQGMQGMPMYNIEQVNGGPNGYRSYRAGYNGTVPFAGGDPSMMQAQQAMNMAISGFNAWAGYDVASRYANRGNGGRCQQFYPEQALAYGQQRGNMQHGYQRYPHLYQRN